MKIMKRYFNRLNVGAKLPLILTLIVAITIFVMSVANALMTKSIILHNAQEKLESISHLKVSRIQELLNEIDRTLRITANAPATAQALLDLAEGYASTENPEELLRQVYITANEHPLGEKDKLVEANTGSSYGAIHASYHPVFDELQNEMDFYDIFLFDLRGNLVYSVFKENDFATNMETGEWKNTGLADAYRQGMALKQGQPSVFADFAPYAPSNFAPAAFMSRPVFDSQGSLIGVLALQMPIGNLNKASNELDGLGETVDGFIVGANGLMRTDSRISEVDDILRTTVELETFKADSGTFETIAHSGRAVLGYYKALKGSGPKWIFVVQQDSEEIFSSLRWTLIIAAAISSGIFLSALLVSIFLSRSISLPVRRLTKAVNQVADGELTIVVPETERGDEIGDLARATEVFRQNSLRIEKMNEEQIVASKKMTELNSAREKATEREMQVAREREETDQRTEAERIAMMSSLGSSFGKVVQNAIAGKFSSRV